MSVAHKEQHAMIKPAPLDCLTRHGFAPVWSLPQVARTGAHRGVHPSPPPPRRAQGFATAAAVSYSVRPRKKKSGVEALVLFLSLFLSVFLRRAELECVAKCMVRDGYRMSSSKVGAPRRHCPALVCSKRFCLFVLRCGFASV